MNLSISLQCNQRCSFCFAEPLMKAAQMNGVPPFMTEEVFQRGLAIALDSQEKQVRFLGGEPTLHPSFVRWVEDSVSRGLNVVLFSNGKLSDAILDVLSSYSPESLCLILNTGVGGVFPKKPPASVAQTFETLGERVALSATIHHPRVELTHAFDWIDKYGLDRVIRVGVAHPVPGGNSSHLRPRHYNAVGEALVAASLEAESRGVELDLDCGFVPCMFPEESVPHCMEKWSCIGESCGPIPDVLPDGELIPCYPLAALMETRLYLDDLGKQRGILQSRIAPLAENKWLFRGCAQCAYRLEGMCDGGCVAARLHAKQGHLDQRSSPQPASVG